MLLIPAIDLQKGRCVRLRQGDLENNITVYNEDAVDQACQWADLGAERIHIVDLDGAKTGKPVNAPLIREMIEEIGEDAEIEVGGGIRTLDQIEAYLDAGVRYAVIGTAAVKTPGFLKEACAVFTDSIIVALDAKDGIVATDGCGFIVQLPLPKHISEQKVIETIDYRKDIYQNNRKIRICQVV